MQGIFGVLFLIVFAWLCSERRDQIDVRFLGIGLFAQFSLAFLFFQVPLISDILMSLNFIIAAIEAATLEGTRFLFGYLGGGSEPFEVSEGGYLYLFAFRVLPNVIVFCVLIAVLWYWKILPKVITGFGFLLRRVFKVSGAVGTSAAATLFLGMVETPMIIRAYLTKLTRSEFFTVMTCGMSTVAGSVMIIYANTLSDIIPGAIGHIVVGSVLNIVGAIYVSRIIVPEDSTPTSTDKFEDLGYRSTMDAITRGTQDGLKLALNIGGMLLVIISLVALVNGALGLVAISGEPLSLQRMLGWLFSPLAWLIGVPWSEAYLAGNLMGSKIVLNEMIAFIELAALGNDLSENSRLVLLYALCGFANFGSIGIQLGGIGGIAPQRKKEIAKLITKAMIGGALASWLTASVAGILI